MNRSKSAVLCLVLSAMLVAAPAFDGAWAKDGSSGSGSGGSGSGNGSSGSGSSGSASGGSGSSGSGNSGSGNSGRGGNSGSGGNGSGASVVASFGKILRGATKLENSRSNQLTRKKPTQTKKALASMDELQSELDGARKALHEAELKFNRGLADPKADLRRLEQAIRNAENAISAAGAKLVEAKAAE